LCALFASLAVAITPAAAESGAGSELPVFKTSAYPTIGSASAPETYSWRVELEPGEALILASEREAVVKRAEGKDETIWAPMAHDLGGELVRTTFAVSEGDVLTLTVHHHEAEYDYPITVEAPWLLIGEATIVTAPLPVGEIKANENRIIEANPPAVLPPFEPNFTPAPGCRVPKLAGLSRRAVVTKLRADHCTLGKVRLAAGATAGKGKVVKQFHPAGTELAAGAPVAVKLGVGR
jgi:hypothetical protein